MTALSFLARGVCGTQRISVLSAGVLDGSTAFLLTITPLLKIAGNTE